ncbi:hypothetical protein QYE76_001983 [Lolium multiflorum]|uniref:Uncharacterized protein n=1 Tax=Lolium multiflorum TaxID=4521 RepID=A0AAD8RME1_LOLMU|nr:hypothetical protein QYE76_001983 [Lolium multiflorum]
MNAGQIMTWADFKLKFSKYHVPLGLIKKMRDEFRELKQGRMSVVEYRDRFLTLSRYAPDETDTTEKRKERFLNGLHDEMQTVLVNIPFADLEALVDSAIQMEGKLHQANENRKRRMMNQSGPNNTPRLAKTTPNASAPAQQQCRVSTGKKFTPNNPNNRGGRLFHMNAEEAQEAPDVVLAAILQPIELQASFHAHARERATGGDIERENGQAREARIVQALSGLRRHGRLDQLSGRAGRQKPGPAPVPTRQTYCVLDRFARRPDRQTGPHTSWTGTQAGWTGPLVGRAGAQSPRALRGFLGLAGYYRRYIQDFGLIAAPVTRLLRRDAFSWDEEAATAFAALQRALTMGPVLQMPDFDEPFVVDCDASGIGFGAVLHQGEGPLAFFSRPFAARHHKLAAYERELIGLVQAVRHWRAYLWGRTFRVRTDHYSLKFLLDQRLSTVPQHQWISKLFGFDFTVEYRPGRLNTVADALSRRDVDDAADAPTVGAALCIHSGPSFVFIDEVRRATATAADAQQLRQRLADGELAAPWRLDEGLLLHGRRIFVPDHGDLRHQALSLAHSAGHEGAQKTLHRLRADFYIPGDGALVRDWVRACVTCQRNKTETLRPAGLLQPLDVPSQVWADISMDFIEGLPKVGGKSVILTVVDRFSKYAHFIALGHPYTAASVARAFFDGIVRLHGFPSSIVSDRDPVFTGHVWRDLFGLAGVKLRMSTAFHPQTDGQSEVVNKIIAMYLRCITGDRPRAWVDWLAWAEYCYNTSYHSALHATPFEVVYGRPPPAMLPYTAGTARTETADDLLRTRDEILAEARQRLLQAQQLARKYYDAHHREAEFAVGDWVWLRLLHRTTQSLDPRSRRKLGPRYAGSRLHDVFNVGLLKAYRGDPPSAPPALPPTSDGRLEPAPASVARVLKAQQRRGVWHVLVHWTGLPEDEATWEKLEDLRQQFPEVQLEDELFEKAGRDVMVGLTYTRRKPTSG